MKRYERSQAAAFPYFKLAAWDARSLTWRDGKVAFDTERAAAAAARGPGRYRISRVEESGRVDLAPFGG